MEDGDGISLTAVNHPGSVYGWRAWFWSFFYWLHPSDISPDALETIEIEIKPGQNRTMRINDFARKAAALHERIAELDAALSEALDGWEDAAAYKGDYLRDKHGDLGGITRLRAVRAKG